MDRERARKDYVASKMASDFLDKTFKMIGFTAEQRKFFCERPQDFRHGDTPREFKPDFTQFTSAAFDGSVFRFLYAALQEVRERRGRLSHVNETNIFAQAKLNSEVCVRSLVGTMFPKLKVDKVYAKKTVDHYIDCKCSTYFVSSYDITIPVTWARTVGDKYIADVTDGKLSHLVLRAHERKLERLNAEDIKAYKCLSMTGNNGKPKLHDVWVMHWKNDTTSITALSTEFSKAEKLLRRRIKKAVTDVLLDL